MMHAVVAGTIAFDSSQCPPKIIEKLRRDLSFPNPEYVSRRRMGRRVVGIPERIECLVEGRDGWIEIPRGAEELLRNRLNEVGASVEFEDRRCVHQSAGLRAEIELRPYQLNAIEKLRRGIQGVVVMPCGGGKTVAATAAIAVIDQPTLIVVHTRDLLEQWRDTIHRILGIEAGVVVDGACNPSTVTVATIQTLTRLALDDLYQLSTQFGCVIVDEAHHTPASTFQTVLRLMPARYRFGLTATPQREDGLTPLVDFTIGRRLFEIAYSELVAEGYLDAPEVRPVYSNFNFPYKGPDDHNACMTALVNDNERNDLISDLAAREAQDGHYVLVLSGRVNHCRYLAQMITEHNIRIEVLVGATKKTERHRILDDFRAGRLRVVVASTLADEGLDVPRLDRIILAFPGRAKGRTTQRIGRLMRPHPEKRNAVLYDVVDAAVPHLLRQFLERRRVYQRLTT